MSLTTLLGIAKPMPGALPPPSWGSVAPRVGIPITLPWMSTRAPPELPGLIAALVWITDGNVTLPPSSGTASRKALTIPSVTLDCSPSGLPIAIARSPTFSIDESANFAGFSPAPETLMTARSSGGKAPTSFPWYCLPLEVVTVNDFAPVTTWLLVTMSPAASKTIPEPSPVLSSICTTDGETDCTTLTNESCSATPATVCVPVVLEWPELVASDAPAIAAPATATAARTASRRRCCLNEKRIRSSNRLLHGSQRAISSASSGGQPRATSAAISCQSTRPANATERTCGTPRRCSCSTFQAWIAISSSPTSSTSSVSENTVGSIVLSSRIEVVRSRRTIATASLESIEASPASIAPLVGLCGFLPAGMCSGRASTRVCYDTLSDSVPAGLMFAGVVAALTAVVLVPLGRRHSCGSDIPATPHPQVRSRLQSCVDGSQLSAGGRLHPFPRSCVEALGGSGTRRRR